VASGEFELIDAFLGPFGGRFARGSGVIVGPGSDCAVVQPARGQKLVATVDAAVEGVHFTLQHFSPEDVGHKALAINLSDLAAAGARPRWFLCALGVPRNINERSFINQRKLAVGMARGMARLARRHGVALVGGNVTAASE
jgi:thiamine-monophosphate kinase